MSNGTGRSSGGPCAWRSRSLRTSRSTELGQHGSGRCGARWTLRGRYGGRCTLRGGGNRRCTLRRRCGRRNRFHRGAVCPSGPSADRCLADRRCCCDLCRRGPRHLPRLRRRLRRNTVAIYRCVVVPQRQPGLPEQGHADSGRRYQARGPQHGAHAVTATPDVCDARCLGIVSLDRDPFELDTRADRQRDSGHRCRRVIARDIAVGRQCPAAFQRRREVGVVQRV
jgi:hypothetical protein